MLPSPEAVVPLLTQCDKCNALATKGWLRLPDKDPQSFAQGTATLTIAEWRALCRQLESELGEASYQIQKFQSETSKLFAEAEHSISISNPAVSETYIDKLQGRYAQYAIFLHEAKDTLKQAKRLTSELRYWEFRPPAAVENNLLLSQFQMKR